MTWHARRIGVNDGKWRGCIPFNILIGGCCVFLRLCCQSTNKHWTKWDLNNAFTVTATIVYNAFFLTEELICMQCQSVQSYLSFFIQRYSNSYVMLLQYFLYFLYVIGANFTPSVWNLRDLYVMASLLKIVVQ